MVGRSVSVDDYRYSFNGKEKENEIASGDLDFGARIYDARLGRWLSVDPLQMKYPDHSPYCFAINNPIAYVDPDGMDITPAGSLISSPYYKVYQDLKANNSAYGKMLAPYNNTGTNMRLTIEVDDEKAKKGGAGFTSWDGMWLKSDGKTVLRCTTNVALLSSYPTGTTDIGVAWVIIHETLHAYEGSQNAWAPNHNGFNKYHTLMLEALTEYNKEKGLGLTETQLFEISIWSTDGSDLYKNYIQGLADKNGTTFEEEEGAYYGRISGLFDQGAQPAPKAENDPAPSGDSVPAGGNDPQPQPAPEEEQPK